MIPSASPNWKRDLLQAVEQIRNDNDWQKYLRDLYEQHVKFCNLGLEKRQELAKYTDPNNVTPRELAIDEKYDVKLHGGAKRVAGSRCSSGIAATEIRRLSSCIPIHDDPGQQNTNCELLCPGRFRLLTKRCGRSMMSALRRDKTASGFRYFRRSGCFAVLFLYAICRVNAQSADAPVARRPASKRRKPFLGHLRKIPADACIHTETNYTHETKKSNHK